MSKALKGIIKLECKIRVLTGLHIGGSKENVEIGGIDNIVIKVPVLKLDEAIERDVPYIPGSSIKGKMRALLEWVEKPKYDTDSSGLVIALVEAKGKTKVNLVIVENVKFANSLELTKTLKQKSL
jgi:Uncharacterized protein predicted to be involved in DNA repair (RAMP superfamily)